MLLLPRPRRFETAVVENLRRPIADITPLGQLLRRAGRSGERFVGAAVSMTSDQVVRARHRPRRQGRPGNDFLNVVQFAENVPAPVA